MSVQTARQLSSEVLVVGAGVGGICAAVAAARTGAKVLLIEKAQEIGGTGVHSPVSLVCKFHGTDHRPINLGIHQELFPEIYAFSTRDKRPTAKRLTYDENLLLRRYHQLINKERNLEVLKGNGVLSVQYEGERIRSVVLEDGTVIKASVFIDSTADGNLAALAGCEFQMGRESDGKMQSATRVFGLSGIRSEMLKDPDFTTRQGLESLWAELNPIFKEAKHKGETSNMRDTVVAFPYPDGKRLLFNSTAITGVDPTDDDIVNTAMKEGKKQIDELVSIIRQHSAFASAKVDFIASKLGVREGRRIIGKYILTQEDCLGEARFPDMVAACAYELDIHNPEGGNAHMEDIPGSGYYHIPYRSIVSKDRSNLILGSRCISGTHEAHSSYRVMSGVSAIGQAAGTAAAIAQKLTKGNVWGVKSEWVRYALRAQAQFVEGACEPLPDAP